MQRVTLMVRYMGRPPSAEEPEDRGDQECMTRGRLKMKGGCWGGPSNQDSFFLLEANMSNRF